MRLIGLTVFLLVVIAVYMNQSYAAFFNRIKTADLKPPATHTNVLLGNVNGETKIFTFIGDSLTAGVGATTEKKTIAYLVTENIADKNAVTLYNFGHPGARVKDLIPISKKLSTQKSDLTVIFIGINDLFNRTPTNDFRNDLNRIVKNSSTNDTKVALLTIPFLGTTKSVPFPFDIFYNVRLQMLNTQIKEVAAENNAQLIDLYLLTQGKLNNQTLFAQDHFHPSDNGYILLADIISGELKK